MGSVIFCLNATLLSSCKLQKGTVFDERKPYACCIALVLVVVKVGPLQKEFVFRERVICITLACFCGLLQEPEHDG